MAGDKAAMFELADYSLKQAETPEQRAAALVLVREAAEAGSAEAKVSLASELLLTEAGNKDNLQKAVLLLEEAETLKPGSGALPLARLYLDGSAGEKNEQEAEKWLQTAAATDSPIAIYLLGDLKGGGIDTIWPFVDRVFGGKSVFKNKKEVMELYERAARLGYAPAQRSMAWLLYSRGDQSEAEKQRAFQMASDAAAQGDAIAMTYLAAFYEIGYGVRQNPSEAYRWYKNAADKGDISGRYNLAEVLIEGRLHPRDISQAVSLLDGLTRETARSEWWAARSKTKLGEVLARLESPQKNPKRAIVLWEEVKSIDPRAAHNLGLLYLFGSDTVPKDINKALEHLELCASGGKFSSGESVEAMNLLGSLYGHGANGAPKNKELAIKWLKKAIGEESIRAKSILGELLASTATTAQERKEALRLLGEAAQQEDSGAQLTLARIAEEGKIAKPDLEKSNTWLRKAVANGNQAAALELGSRLFLGKAGIERDHAEALRVLLPTAHAGNAEAMFLIANIYEQGGGVSRSYFDAYKWLLIASKNAPDGLLQVAQLRADNLESKLTTEQISEAQTQAASFSPAPPFNPSAPYEVLPNKSASGSGFCITADGHIATNAHVVNAGRSFKVFIGDKAFEAKVVSVDQANDLAILKIDAVTQAVPIASSSSVKLGATVATVGYPNTTMQGRSPKLAKGEIASLTGALDDPRFFQISVPIQPGNSGGALLDESGNVVGVVSNKLNAQAALTATGYLPENVNFAVKSSLLLTLIESLPQLKGRLLQPSSAKKTFEDVVEGAKAAAVFIAVSSE